MKKPALALLMGDDEEKAPDSSKDVGDEDSLTVAAEEMFEALKDDDKEGFVAAVKAALSR